MKNKLNRALAFVFLLVVSSCDDTDLGFTSNQAIGFSESAQQLRALDSEEVEINLAFNVALTTDASVTINVLGINGFVYGVDYTTEPAASSGQISLALTTGATEATIKYLGITKAVTDSKTVLFQLEAGTNIALGQAFTQEFSLTLTATVPITISYNFNDCIEEFSVPSGFTEVIVPGFKTDRGWGCRSNGMEDGSRAPRASAFGGEEGEGNAWLVMNPINLSGYGQVNLSFYVNSFFDGPGQVVVQWSSDYDGSSDPTGFTWNVLTDINAGFPAAGSNTWTNVNGAIIGITGTEFYLALQFVGGTSSSSSSWDIDNLILTGN